MKKVIIDVDTGIDDALAIIYALNIPELDILGITTVAGNVDVESATQNTLKVLEICNRLDIDVYKGCSRPLIRDIVFPEGVHGPDGLGGLRKNLKNSSLQKVKKVHAVDFIINTVKENPGEVTLILLAPETNLAFALRKSPEIKTMIKEIFLMGGVVNQRGNISPVAEFNIYQDPESASIVFNSGIPITMLGLNITHQAVLTRKHLEKFHKNSRFNTFIYTLIDFYLGKNEDDIGFLHDPLTVAAAINKNFFSTVKGRIDIETNSIYCDGQTIWDQKNKDQKPFNVDIALKFNYDLFINHFLQRVRL